MSSLMRIKRLFAKKTKNMNEGVYKDLALDFQAAEKYHISLSEYATDVKRLIKKYDSSKNGKYSKEDLICLIDELKALTDNFKQGFDIMPEFKTPKCSSNSLMMFQDVSGKSILPPFPEKEVK